MASDELSSYELAKNMAATIQSSSDAHDVSVSGSERDPTALVVVDGDHATLKNIATRFARPQDKTEYFSIPSFQRLVITIQPQDSFTLL
jgi:hypothetical protein